MEAMRLANGGAIPEPYAQAQIQQAERELSHPITVTIDSLKYQLVSARSEKSVTGTIYEYFDFVILASGTASGPVGSYLLLYPERYDQLVSGWKLAGGGGSPHRHPGDPKEMSWTATFHAFPLSATLSKYASSTSSDFNGKKNTFEITAKVEVWGLFMPEQKITEAKKQVTIPHP